MNRHALYHEPKSRWAYAADAKTLHLRLRAAKGDLQQVLVYAADPFNWFPDGAGSYGFDMDSIVRAPMKREYGDALFDYWFCEITGIPSGRIRYAFEMNDGKETLCYGAGGFSERIGPGESNMLAFFNFPAFCEEDLYDAPAWAAETVWYQIFTDRFACAGSKRKDARPWGTEGEKPYLDFYGGNLAGVREKLPYIADLGFTGLYFTPLFLSPSTHKYDTTDYKRIDPSFGSNEDFGALVEEAHGLGLRVMLDAVFNHCGFWHPFFQDVIARGKESPYYSCFFIKREPVLNFALENGHIPALSKEQQKNLPYETFAYAANMPKWNASDPLVREYLLGVARYWVEEYHIDGWRLDVSNEVSHGFWRELRSSLRRIKPDLLLVGENWDDAMPWLAGDQFDSTMNYPLMGAILRYVKGGTAEEFFHALSRDVLAAYPKPVQTLLFNLLGSHDTDRLLSICDEKAEAARLAFVLLLTMGGSPSIYCGDELGQTGRNEGGTNRRCMPWDTEPPEGRDFRPLLKNLISLRKTHPSFRAADIELIPCGKALVYRKRAEGESLLVLLNNRSVPESLALPESLEGYTDAETRESLRDSSLVLPAYGYRLLLS